MDDGANHDLGGRQYVVDRIWELPQQHATQISIYHGAGLGYMPQEIKDGGECSSELCPEPSMLLFIPSESLHNVLGGFGPD